jgi:hypothetical protein
MEKSASEIYITINLTQFREIGKQGQNYGTQKEQYGYGKNSTGSESSMWP